MKGFVDVRQILAATLGDVEAIFKSPVVMRDVLNDLRNAERVLGKRLRDEVVKHGSLDSRFTGAQALAMQQQVLVAIDYVQDRIRGKTAVQAEAAIQQGLKSTISTLEGLDKRFMGVATPLRLREADQLRAAAGTAKGTWARQFPTSVDRYGTKMLGEFEEVIRAGLVAGSSMNDIIAALTGHGGPKGTVSMRAVVTPKGVLRLQEAEAPEGLFVRNKYWVERLVRTEMLRAYNGARQVGMEESAKQIPSLKRKIIAVLDKRTAKDSLAVHGQIRNMKEHFVDGAGRSYLHPPARPNDRETVIPWRTEWQDSSENLSDMEKACLGDLDKEGEDKLFKRMQAIANGGKAKPPEREKPEKKPTAPRSPRKKEEAPPPTPMAAPAPKTHREKMEEEFRSRMQWVGGGARSWTDPFDENGLMYDGNRIGLIKKGQNGTWYPYAQSRRGGGEFISTKSNQDEMFADEESAKNSVIAHWTRRAADAAKKIDRWDEAEYKAAVKSEDLPKMRRLVKGILHQEGVVPRDAFLADPAKGGEVKVVANSKMPDARAAHHWDGRVDLRKDVFDEAKGGPEKFRNHLRTMIHEELHGSTKFTHAGFYAGYGATIEEVTVEMAARKISSSVVGEKPVWYQGSYQPQIDKVSAIVHESVQEVRGVKAKPAASGSGPKTFDELLKDFQSPKGDDLETREAIANAGVKMRGYSKERNSASPDDMVDVFLDNLDVPAAAKPRIRARILNEVKAPR
jgi:hypothetical protein